MDSNFYKGKNVLVIGGTGFIGVNLVQNLDDLGANITILTRGKTKPAVRMSKRIKFEVNDISISSEDSMLALKNIIKGAKIIFDLAGKSGAVSSSQGPYLDIQNNVVGQYNLLEACRNANPSVRIIFLSSRLVYGKALSLPVTENHPNNPTSIYGVNKLTAEKYHLLFNANYDIKTTILRVTVPYGLNSPDELYNHGIINLFLRKAMNDEVISIYGDGKQLRDIIYIGDLVNAILKIPMNIKTEGEIYNVGSGEGISLSEIAENVCKFVGKGKIEYIEWPAEALKVETGDFYCDIKKMEADLNWKPEISLSEGIELCIKNSIN